ncbi:LmeA family phospholipid-binding protein [Gordonia shandongensis]|uniref:LmeA family phospholipid-binding protein n=1 Tax=Gordonia shandongensis TaxID=376351 RepID=UPI000409EEC8|nr:DUF2993 domain-containing protein [Gordonia shandongensis]
MPDPVDPAPRRAARPASRRALRAAAWFGVIVVVAAVATLIVNDVAGSRAEHRLARAVQASPHVRFEPEVLLGGFPFLTRMSDGEFSSVLVSARGVRQDGCGDRGECTVTVDGRLEDARTGPTADIGPRTPLTGTSLTAETRIDSPNLGRLMNIVDLYVNTPAPEDEPGGGGPGDGLLERTDGIMLSGTVPLPGSPDRDGRFPPSAAEYRHPKVKVSVSARVRVVDGRVRIQAYDLYDGPEEHYSDDVPEEFRSAVLKRFSTTLPELPMAWGVPPKSALSRGSDLIVTGRDGAREVRPDEYLSSWPEH